MDSRSVERKLAAIMSADVEGYSRLMGDDEVATVRAITESREVIAASVAGHGGRVVDAPGDNVLAEFASVVDAVQGAVEIQQKLQSRNAERPPSRQMRFRIGINLGDVIVEGERLYGDGVNIAANFVPAQAYRAVVLSELGRVQEGRAAWDKAGQISPGASLSVLRARLPYKRSGDLDRFLTEAHRVGMP